MLDRNDGVRDGDACKLAATTKRTLTDSGNSVSCAIEGDCGGDCHIARIFIILGIRCSSIGNDSISPIFYIINAIDFEVVSTG